MFVIADMEWVQISPDEFTPTQIAAVKTDSSFEIQDKFFSLICPSDSRFYQWNHIAYSGGDAQSFLSAPPAADVFSNFMSWLSIGDTILWWHNDSKKLFSHFTHTMLQKNVPNKMTAITDTVHAHISCNGHRQSLYAIAEKLMLSMPEIRHNSCHDVMLIRDMLAHLNITPSMLSKQAERENEAEYRYTFVYDNKNKTAHKSTCKLIPPDAVIKGHEKIEKAVKRKYAPCSCCKDEYKGYIKQRAESIAYKSPYKYLYLPDSKIFHHYTCKCLQYSYDICGAKDSLDMLLLGKRPCKICKPMSNSINKKTPESKQKNTADAYIQQKCFPYAKQSSVTFEEEKALKRLDLAKKERRRRLQNEGLSEQEKRDIYTLTQPRFAFWSAPGYMTFHTSSCPKLNGLSHLKGYSLFGDAVKDRKTPCKKCKPTYKNDITVSIPIYNEKRENERLDDITQYCTKEGYTSYIHKKDGQIFLCIETPVGKWKIDTETMPINVYHINLTGKKIATDYHKQHRIFLSLYDVFTYIKRHDDNLMPQTTTCV